MTTLLTLLKNCFMFFAAFVSLALITYNDPLIVSVSFLTLSTITVLTAIKIIKVFAAHKLHAKANNHENTVSALDKKDIVIERLDPEYLFNEASSSYLDIDPYMQQFNLNLINHKIKNCKLNQIIHDKKRAYLNKEMDLI